MAKQIDLNKTVYELTSEYPEIINIMADLGFKEIRSSAIRNSAGRLMTIPRGAKIKGVDILDILTRLQENGFELVGTPPVTDVDTVEASERETAPKDPSERRALLKSYLQRLNSGEDLSKVRAEFARNFKDVEASEIIEAEQEMLAEGMPLQQVQQLCDVHSALFHGNTREEKIANAEKEVEESARRRMYQSRFGIENYDEHAHEEVHSLAQAKENRDRATGFRAMEGHPLNVLYKENDVLEALVGRISGRFGDLQQAMNNGEKAAVEEAFFHIVNGVREAAQVAVHYAKKGDLLYPMLKEKYGIAGPSQVMWTLDDEIRAEFGKLIRQPENKAEWFNCAANVLNRAVEMVYKENNILFPLCAANFKDDEWKQIYLDSKDYDVIFGVAHTTWKDGDDYAMENTRQAMADDKVVLPGGTFTLNELRAVLNTLPIEITFVDNNNINRFFNEGPKLFKRPTSALGREVFSCHPPKIEPMVRGIINDLRNGKRKEVPVWMVKNGRHVLVNYMAVRDADGNYVGTMEVVQDMEAAYKHFAGSSHES